MNVFAGVEEHMPKEGSVDDISEFPAHVHPSNLPGTPIHYPIRVFYFSYTARPSVAVTCPH